MSSLPSATPQRMLRRVGWRLASAFALVAGLAALPLAAAAQAPDSTRRPPGFSDNPRLRYEHLMARRSWPRGEVLPGALQAAKAEYRAQWPADLGKRRPTVTAWDALQARASREAGPDGAPSPFASERWTPLGPSPIPGFGTSDAGRITTIAVHPTDRQTLYVGGAQGGVWKTTDGGASWRPLTDAECSLAMGSLAIDPAAPDIVYAGTGELNFSGDSYYGCGVLRSTDGGATWSRLGASVWDSPTGGASIATLLVDPASAGSTTATTLHVASSLGVYRSTDGGASWTRTIVGTATDLVFDPTTDGRVLYAALGSPSSTSSNGVYKSEDRGATWRRLSNGWPTANVGRVALTHAGTAGTLIAAVQDAFGLGGNDGGLLGLWRSTDAGESWTQLPTGGASCGSQCWYDMVVAYDPANASRVFFGGVSMYRSLDGGTSFQPNGNGVVHVDHHAWAFDRADSRIMYAGTDGGIYKSTDGGTVWTSINGNLELTQFYGGLALHPTDFSRVLGGTQDNGTVEYRGTVAWPRVLGGDGGFTAIHPLNPDTAWAETQWQANGGFSGPRRRSTATGAFELMMSGIAPGDRALFIPPLVMDAARPARVLFGTFRLYETTNSGRAWRTMSPDLSRGGGVISAIATAASDARVVYVGTSDGNVRVTSDSGLTWATAPGLPNRYVEHLVVDPADARRAWAAFSGFQVGHVWHTMDGGASWTNVSGNLPDMPVNALEWVPGSGDLFAGTDLGMFRAAAGGTTWTPFNEGFPNVAVFALAYHANTGTLVAATHGRGVLARSLTSVTVTVALTPAAPAPLVVGDTLELGAAARDGAGAPLATTFTWTSSNAAIASVDANGRAVARGIGTATITVRTAEGATASVGIVTRPLDVAAGHDSVRFASLTDTLRLAALILARNGAAIAGAVPQWTMSDTSVASVGATTGLVRALRNGTTLAVVRAGGVADTVTVRVRQVATQVAILVLPDTFVVGEQRTVDVQAQDARGQAIADAQPAIASSAPSVVRVDPARRLVALALGQATVRVTVDSASAARDLVVVAPSTLTVSAAPLATGAASSARGAVLTLLRITLRVDGREGVQLDSLGFDLVGSDRHAVVRLVPDFNGNGAADDGENALAESSPVALTPGVPVRVRVRAVAALAARETMTMLAQVVLGGGAPHGSDVSLALVPAETRTTALLSRHADLVDQPAQPVSATRRTTVLAAGEAIALSENPVRGSRVVMNFREAPRTAAVYTLTGRRVADLRRRMQDDVRVEWDLTNDQGSPIAPGVYLVIFDVGGQVVRQKLFVTRGSGGTEE